ncbi:hypothetical protein GCK72_022427 [Caenorhabditis remanei]|uniref:Uncharacterized protein n=1 Tax=Caenorhabditis remanei TaxID=31234 RepID=A0A6A5FTR2_CAERE|nr:hypothetical protein GCK72_022427 [Caenorhabditis remanei]KAF1745977.1 hypothetical protein GCK72_022427 [Caenorhabditis remanei]
MKIKASGEFFYDRQASLYSRTKLTAKDNIKLEFRAVFELKDVAESYQAASNGIRSTVHQAPALADKTLIEAISIFLSGPAYSNKNVITVGSCVHYVLDTSEINLKMIKNAVTLRWEHQKVSKVSKEPTKIQVCTWSPK